MAIKIKFDTNDIPEIPTFVLSKRSGDKIGMLSNITNIQLKDCLNNAPEISFTVHKYDNGNECAYWEDIKDLKLVWCKEWDMWFEMTIDTNISDETIKNVSLVRLAESELSQTNLYNIEINTELDIARDEYTEPTIIYNAENSSASLLNRILEKAPHYSIRHVDVSIAKIQRTFTFDGKSIVDALQEIATEINALVVYYSGTDENGRIERCISLYDLESNCLDCGYRGEFTDTCPQCQSKNIKEGYGEDTTICIDDENMLGDDITLEVDTDSVKNCFKLVAGDDLMTATVINCNPNGTAYIWYLPDTTKDDMSDELRDKVNSYNALYEEYRKTKQFEIPSYLLTKYNNLVDKYKTYNQELEYISNPIIGYPNLMNAYYNTIDLTIYLESGLMPSLSTDEITASSQAELLTSANLSPISVNNIDNLSITTSNSAVLGIAKLLVHPSYKVKINQSSLNNRTWSGNFEVVNMSDENDSAISNTISITINNDYNNFVNQKLDKILSDYYEEFNTDISSLFKKDLSNFSSQLKKYSLNGLNSLYDACQSCLDILIEQGVSSDTTTTLYNSLYLPYYNKLSVIQSEINVREQEINIIVNLYDDDTKGVKDYIDDIRFDMQENLNFEKYIGSDLWSEFCSFRREDTYDNSNYISDGLNNADLFKKALEFIDVAQKEIYKSANLQHKLTSSLKNLLVIKEFRKLVDYFSCGNWIRIKIDDTLYKLRLLEFDIDFDNLDSFNVVFSDVTYGVDGMTDTKSILDKAGSMATSYDSVKRQASQGADGNNRLQNWVYNGLDATTINIINRAENQTQSWDKHGMLYRQYDDITESYLDTQLKIINQGLYITDDNWKTTRTGIGKFIYLDPKDGLYKEGYGVIADTICSNLILSEEVGIYNADSSIVINKDGISISDPNNTSSNKPSVTITPDGKLTCNGATIRGDIYANSLTLTPNAMNGLVDGLDDKFVPFDKPIRDSQGNEYYVQIDSNGLLQAENAYISGTIYTSKLVGCTIDITDGINFRSKETVECIDEDSNGNFYVSDTKEIDLYSGSIYKKYNGTYLKYDEDGRPTSDFVLNDDTGTLFIDTSYDVLNKKFIDNIDIDIVSGSNLWLNSIRNLNISSVFDLEIEFINKWNSKEYETFTITGGDINISTMAIKQEQILKIVFSKYGLSEDDYWDMHYGGITQVKFNKFLDTLNNEQKISLIEDLGTLQQTTGGDIHLDSKNIYASCGNFTINGALGFNDNIEGVSFFCEWGKYQKNDEDIIEFVSDGNHNLITRLNDGLTSIYGWNGTTDFKTKTIIRGYSLRFACGGTNGENDAVRVLRLDYDPTGNGGNGEVMFRPTVANSANIGSNVYRFKGIYGLNGYFNNLYEDGSALSSIYEKKGHTHPQYVTSSHTHSVLKNGSNDWQCSANGNLIPRTNGTDTSGKNVANSKSTLNCVYSKKMDTSSDIRLKNDLGDLEISESIKLLNGLKPKKYTYKNQDNEDIYHGLYAQDLRDLLVDSGIGYYSALGINIINDESDDCKRSYNLSESEENVNYGIDYNQFIADLINGWKYHEEELNELKSKVKEQQIEIDELKQKLNTLIEG